MSRVEATGPVGKAGERQPERNPLFEFAYVPGIEDRLEELASLAYKENWDYRLTSSPRPKPILYSYLRYTFERLRDEGQVMEHDAAACFNTGLVTENQEEIFAYFVPNTRPEPRWKLQAFARESDRRLLQFGTLPPMAHYFDDPSELLYDTRLNLRKNLDHIINDNQGRFPEPYSSPNTELYALRIALEGAIDHTIKRVQRNYKTAVPQFYHGRIQLLLPLSMSRPSVVDLALAVERQGDVYLASTCLTLDMAYNNARLIARPDNEWLVP